MRVNRVPHEVAKGSLYCVISLRPLLDYVVHRLQQKIRRQHWAGGFLCARRISLSTA